MPKPRSMQCIFICWLMAASLAMLACSNWQGSGGIWGSQGSAYPFTDRAMDHFRGSIRYKQGDSRDHYRLGRFFQEQGRHRLAVNEFSRSLELDPQQADALNAMGVSYDKLLQFDLAEQCYHWALMVKPDFAAAYNNLGYSYLMQGEPQRAISPLQKAVALQRRNIRFHNNLALAYGQTGQVAKVSAEMVLSGQEQYKEALDRRSHLSAAIDLTQEDHPVTNAGEDENRPIYLVPIKSSGADPLADKSRQDASNPLQDNQDKWTGSGATMANASAEPLWIAPQIEISNGNGVYKMARNMGRYFKSKGFDVLRLSNADHFKYSRTRIYYGDGQRQIACDLSQLLFGPEFACDLINSGRQYGQVKILMGEDVAGLNDLFSGRMKIQVANGNGVNAIARRLTSYLRTKGFFVVHPTNAEHFGYPFTQIIYPTGQLAKAQFLAREFPENRPGRLVEDQNKATTIYIVIGKDFTL